jgi:hypothetical protein
VTAPAPAIDYFAQLCAGLGARPDRKGEVWLPCPSCGKERDHFSFSPNGAFCLKCGYRPALRALFEALIGGVVVQAAPRPAPRPAAPRPWQGHAAALAASFAATPGTVAAWQKYKPLPADVIRARQLGLGPWPGALHFKKAGEWQRCDHRRLIVPLFSNGDVCGFRCRSFECGCKKWLSPGGTELVLYGELPQGAELLAIVENPADALLAASVWGQPAVATMGTQVWKDEYTDQVRQACPRSITVVFDSDQPGQDAAVTLSNRLLESGLKRVYPFDWTAHPGIKDIGEMFHA